MISNQFPKVASVRAYIIKPTSSVTDKIKSPEASHGADCHDVIDGHWIDGHPTPIANPMSIYKQYAVSRKSWGINALGSLVVEVEAEDGTTGIGVSIGGEPGCYIVEHHLSRFIEGQDPRNVELMWDQMYRATINYGRKGLPLQAISAVDLALWDLVGKLRKEPVYAMLGGKTKERLPVYATTAKPDLAKQMGFVAAKVPCPYSASAGDVGFNRNVEFLRDCRAKVGQDFPLMLDCYMSLTLPYSIRLARALEPVGLKWIEECLHPDDYEGYSQLKVGLQSSGSSVLVSTGEHEYTRYGFAQLIKSNCAHILQPDVTWVGGITEARRIVALAAAHDLIVIPHGSSIYSYHLQYAFVNCPVAEFIMMAPTADKIVPYFGNLFLDEPLPSGDGFIDLPDDRYGFGVTINREVLCRPNQRNSDESKKQFQQNVQSKKSINSAAFMPF